MKINTFLSSIWERLLNALTKSSQFVPTRMHSDCLEVASRRSISCSSQSDDVQEDAMPDAGSGSSVVRAGVPTTISSEPQISQRRTRDRNLVWLTYDPLADQAINFGSEQEVKTWLDQRYY